MDLLDKKLLEKLKLFEIIDKTYGANIDQSSLKKKESTNNTKNTDNYYSNNEIYDDIYSDFKTNSYKSFFYSPSSANILDSNIPKNNHKKNLIKNIRKCNLSRNVGGDKEYSPKAFDVNLNRSKSSYY